MKTGNEIKKEIKTTLGYNTRDLSVRVDHSSINISVKSCDVSVAKVTAIVEKYRSVDRCQYTGEILSGGNTYVFVSYSHKMEIVEELFNKIMEITTKYRDTFDTSKCTNWEKQNFWRQELGKIEYKDLEADDIRSIASWNRTKTYDVVFGS